MIVHTLKMCTGDVAPEQSLVLFILANSANPDEMWHSVAFHLDLQCLPKYSFRCFQYKKDSIWHCLGRKNACLIYVHMTRIG